MLQKKWIAVLQYPIVAFIDAVATSITEAADIYCLESNKAYFGHVWVSDLLMEFFEKCIPNSFLPA